VRDLAAHKLAAHVDKPAVTVYISPLERDQLGPAEAP
jgi:hypothetical protein